KIQRALVILGAGVINVDEIVGQTYGTTTARTVRAYKGPPRNIINHAYQSSPDDIVGIRTITALDQEMFDFENQPPPPPTTSSVSLTHEGDPHDHSQCPFGGSEPGPDGRVEHLATPINPNRFGRMINIGGEGETNYLGFEDFVTDPGVKDGPPRPIT